MSGEELDRLDRECAVAMGFHFAKNRPSEGAWSVNALGGLAGIPLVSVPSPTRSWSDFGALLLWAAEKGLLPMVQAESRPQAIDGLRYYASLMEGTVRVYQGHESDPRVALCKAVSAWREGRKGEGGRA